MTEQTITTPRAGLSEVSQSTSYTLAVLIEERPGSIDRVVGLFRRRRASMQTLVLGRTDVANVVRLSVEVNDSEVAVEQLVEQVRKGVDVRQVSYFASAQAVTRELALIKVIPSEKQYNEIIALAQQYGARIADMTATSLILEIAGTSEQVEHFVQQLQPYTVREVAYSGRVAMMRGTGE